MGPSMADEADTSFGLQSYEAHKSRCGRPDLLGCSYRRGGAWLQFRCFPDRGPSLRCYSRAQLIKCSRTA